MKRIAALIINWNGANDTLELVSSLCSCQNNFITIDVIIVDNASHPADYERLRRGLNDFSGLIESKLRSNTVNVGVPAGYNQCIQLSGLDYDYYLRLDNDVVISPRGLLALIEAMESNIDRGVEIVGGNIKYYDHPELNNGGAVEIDLVRGITSVSYPPNDVICDGVLGCIMLISGKLIRSFSPIIFDPNLFICADESELSLRAGTCGAFTFYVAEEIGRHKSGISTKKVPILSNYYSARNWTLLRWRFLSGWRSIISMMFFVMIDLLKSFVKFRWIFTVGFISGTALAITEAIDRRIRVK